LHRVGKSAHFDSGWDSASPPLRGSIATSEKRKGNLFAKEPRSGGRRTDVAVDPGA
jgi:hypothetical protein